MANNDVIELLLDRPVAGGRMLGRHDGRVVLVAGGIAGERVRARIERTAKHTMFANVIEVLQPSPYRREPACDLRCGGLAYAHITPEHQCRLKGEIVTDALRRIGGIHVDVPAVTGSPEHGYRVRARLHVRHGRAGFFLEGSHALCDAASTGQLHPQALPLVDHVLEQLGPEVALCESISVSESVDASARVLHIEPRDSVNIAPMEGRTRLLDGVTGISIQVGRRVIALAGLPYLTDRARELFHGASPVPDDTQWTRNAASFFQGNRFLTGPLVAHVLSMTEGERVLDLYSGVGLFAVALAARGCVVTAVEGDPQSGEDLALNAARWPGHLTPLRASVEAAVPKLTDGSVDTIVLDPPRTGVSPEALTAILALGAKRLVYVSCDPATLGRDAKGLTAGGYRLEALTGFDLFPNTPHVETVAVFDRQARP